LNAKEPVYIGECTTGVLISPYPDQEGIKLQRQKILIFIYPIYNHNLKNISTVYIYITGPASNKIFSPSNKIHLEVGRFKDLSPPLYSDHATSWKAKEYGGSFSGRERVLFPLALRLTQTHVERFSPLRKEPSALQQQACEADHSLLSTTEIRNAWSLTATPLYVFFMACCLIKG
jgi:hypothetical protein